MPEGDIELQDLYREVLLDYFRSSSHKGPLEDASRRSHGVNPVCGDEVEVAARLDSQAPGSDAKLERIRFSGRGCVISQASSAMMAEALEGATVEKSKKLIKAFKDMMLSKAPLESLPEELENVKALEGVRKYPMRVKCATLAWNTLLQVLEDGKKDGEFEEAA
jgi:nitrogen fixation NifU-like protein